jgi:NAD(P)-dependent dehydrogenase (short-subunit alcohol dehydrogenase family)
VKSVRDASGTAAAAQADVRDPVAVKSALDELEARLAPANQLINCAAGNFRAASEDLSPNAFNSVVQIVLNGTFHCTGELGRRLIERKHRGEILAVTTTYSGAGSAFVLPSACAKAGVAALIRSLAVEWAAYGIRLKVAYLISDASPYLTGDEVTIDGAEALFSGQEFAGFAHLDVPLKQILASLQPRK